MQTHKKRNMATMERRVDIVRLLRALLKRAWIILFAAVLCAIMAFAYAKLFVTPVYRSSFTAYVNNRMTTTEGQSNMTSSDISASRGLTYLYQEIILSRSVLMDAATYCGQEKSYSSLAKNVSTSVSTNAAIIRVSVSAATPEEAEKLAFAIATVAPDHVARVVDGSSMRIVDYPILPSTPYAPNHLQYLLSGFAFTLLIGCCSVIVVDLVVDKVDSPAEIEERYALTVIGVIPDMQQAERYQYSTSEMPRRNL